MKTFFLLLHENICCGYSLEAPHQSASNKYPQNVFFGEIRKISIVFSWKKKSPYLELWWLMCVYLHFNFPFYYRKLAGFYFYLNAIVCGIPASAISLTIERKERYCTNTTYCFVKLVQEYQQRNIVRGKKVQCFNCYWSCLFSYFSI